MEGKTIRALVAILLLLSLPASAAVVEVSGMLAYSKSNFADGYKSLQRRYTGSIDFKFTAVSALQFEYTDSYTEISYPTTVGSLLPRATQEVIDYRDKVYSFNWVQNLVSSKWILQPYFVIGGGRMVRHYRDRLPEYGYTIQNAVQNVVTGTGGLGVRLFLTRNIAIKAEAKTYVPKFRFAAWKDSQMLSLGASWTF